MPLDQWVEFTGFPHNETCMFSGPTCHQVFIYILDIDWYFSGIIWEWMRGE